MGREVKRVPMDFPWPIGKTWHGYLIETCQEPCEDCIAFAKIKGMAFTDHKCPQFDMFEPPVGDGWQMWETVSEGSPISPVCESPDALARWLVDNNASACGTCRASYEQWLAMIGEGWAPSMVFDSEHGIRSGVEGIAQAE